MFTFFQDPGREADDEQSDWPGNERAFGSGSSSGALGASGGSGLFDDDEDDDEDEDDEDDPQASINSALSAFFINPLEMESSDPLTPLTATARQAYLSRMKRLADCVPGREIRAGARKVRNRQSGFTIKSSSSEQLSR